MISYKLKRRFRQLFERLLSEDNLPTVFKHTNTMFIHIPKAAGSSLCLSLYGVQVGHRKLVDYLKSNKSFCDNATKFAICRNPVTRCYSAFNFLKKGGMTRTDKEWAGKYLSEYESFNDFVCHGLIKKNIQSYIHFIPQHKFIEKYPLGPVGVDLIIRMENLNEDFHKIQSLFEHEVKLQHVNVTKYNRKEIGADISEEAIEIIRKVYSRDYWLLGYEKN